MAYDRYDPRNEPRDERSRSRDERFDERGRRSEGRGGRDERGFFERAGDEIASWFGDDEPDRHRHPHPPHDHREDHWGPHDRHGDQMRGRGGFGQADRPSQREPWDRSDHDRDRERSARSDGDRGYRPFAGDYGRRDQESEPTRSQSMWDRDPYRTTSRAGTSDRSDRSRHEDPHYDTWRHRHMSELDRDYDDYRRENQSRFEDDFSNWRNRRQQKRGLLGQVREHMEVVGKDDEHIGTVDKVAGDRIILTKSDPESGGAHHSLSCSGIDRVEGERVILDCSADEARKSWRDESRSRALFEREDQGEMGPGILDRSFSGTYRQDR